MNIERNLNNLNIRFTSVEADNDSIYSASPAFYNETYKEIADRFNCDIDSAEQIKDYLIDQQAMAEGLNVEVWFS